MWDFGSRWWSGKTEDHLFFHPRNAGMDVVMVINDLLS